MRVASVAIAFPLRLFLVLVRKTPGVGVGVIVHEDPVCVPVQIVELSVAGGPEQHSDRDQPEDDHSGNKAVDDFHEIEINETQLLFDARNKVRIRAEFPMMASELRGMETAATKGVTKAAMAKGTMMTL